MHSPTINWPAIIKFDGDAELIYIHDETDWAHNADSDHSRYQPGDTLIDSRGRLYPLSATVNDRALPEPASGKLSQEDIITLVREHAAQAGNCCIEKISAPSIKDVIELVKSLDDPDSGSG
jgi:hypothetical protein